MTGDESAIQRAIVDYLAAVAPEVFVYAIPNSARRAPGARAGNAVAGLRAGAPDLGLVLPGGRAAFLEVKTATGRLSSAQEACAEAIEAAGGLWMEVRSIDDVRRALAAWGVTTRDADAPFKKSGDRV